MHFDQTRLAVARPHSHPRLQPQINTLQGFLSLCRRCRRRRSGQKEGEWKFLSLFIPPSFSVVVL